MAQRGGISGTAVASATAGAVLIYAALADVTPLGALKAILSGKAPGITNAGTPVAGLINSGVAGAIAGIDARNASGHPEIAGAARKYLGIPYKWGGATPAGFDCSGLVTYVLVHDIGMTNLPSSVHTTTIPFLVWKGAVTVAGPPVAGDLICWTGHIAIASGNGMMIEAPHAGANVREVKARLAGATIRRVIIASTATGVPDTKQPGVAF